MLCGGIKRGLVTYPRIGPTNRSGRGLIHGGPAVDNPSAGEKERIIEREKGSKSLIAADAA
jgi:hypothetical protein